MKRLENKVAVIYGDGSIGSAVAKAFAREGAFVFLAGRTQSKMDKVTREVVSENGHIKASRIDALDEHAVHAHMNDVLKENGKIDITFNAIGVSQKGVQGTSLDQLSQEDFFQPVSTYLRSHFITSKVAVVPMVKQRSGVILAHVPNASRISSPFVGGMIPAWAAVEGLFRSLSVEYGARGVRSVCLLTTGIPETPLIDEVWEIHGKSHGITFEQFHEMMEGQTHRKRLTTLKELTNAAVFAASDEGSAITGTIFNLTAGMIVN